MKKIGTLSFILFILLSGCTDDEPIHIIDDNPGGALNNKAVGESANDLLSSGKYRHLQVEVQYVVGFSPTQAALDNLQSFLGKRLNKPDGISFVYTSIPSPNKQSYSANDIANIENAHRSVFSRGDTLGVYFFFADGGYSEDSDNAKILGIAYKNTSMALFEKTIHNLSGGLNQPERSKLETVVLNHEFGHILGLVNVGTPMQAFHQDDAHGKHCDNSNCLMHYTVETGNVVTNLLGSSIPQLDENCIRDLQANGGK